MAASVITVDSTAKDPTLIPMAGSIVLITGGNAGIGFETAARLAEEGAAHIYLTTRSRAKGEAAIDALVAKTKQARSLFEVLVLELNDQSSCRATARQLHDVKQKITHVILNAGGYGPRKLQFSQNSVHHVFGMNVLGHSVLMDELLKGDALVEHATIVFAGSEVANGFGGMPAPKYQSMDAKSIEPFIDGRGFNQSGSALVDRAYSYSKNIQVLYVGALARKHPQHYMVVASPGGTAGTSIMQHARCCSVMGFARCCVPCMLWCGVMHSTQVGAERYLQAAYDPEYRKKFSSGTFTASKKGKLVGEVVDQSTILSMYSEPAYQDAAWEAVHVKHLNE